MGECYGGSNAFPKGFDALVAFLAKAFACKELMAEGGYESSVGHEMRGIDHVVTYADMLVNVEEFRRKRRSGFLDEEEVEAGEMEAEKSARELLRDPYMLVEENPDTRTTESSSKATASPSMPERSPSRTWTARTICSS